jgi:hypothetical protein
MAAKRSLPRDLSKSPPIGPRSGQLYKHVQAVVRVVAAALEGVLDLAPVGGAALEDGVQNLLLIARKSVRIEALDVAVAGDEHEAEVEGPGAGRGAHVQVAQGFVLFIVLKILRGDIHARELVS